MAKTIDFTSSASHIATPPNIGSFDFLQQLKSEASKYKDSILVATSGSTGSHPKIAILSKPGFLKASEAVNSFLRTDSKDVWLLAIPDFHVGGLSIRSRAFLSNSLIIEYKDKWNALAFKKCIEQHKVTRTSLVPTQIFDLVTDKLKAPPSLRSILVGGGMLHTSLFEKACSLGWPLVRTFGMTESSALFAVKNEEQEEFNPLPHIQIKSSVDNKLMIKGEPVLKGYLLFQNNEFHFHDPKQDGWFTSEDSIQITEKGFIFLGRSHRTIKVLGELVSLDNLSSLYLEKDPSILPSEIFFSSLPDLRAENQIIFVTSNKNINATQVKNTFAAFVPRYAIPTKIAYIDKFPLNDMGKIRENELQTILSRETTLYDL